MEMAIDTEDIHKTRNLDCCKSAIEKLINLQLDSILPNEVLMMSLSLDLAYMLLKHTKGVPEETTAHYGEYVFSIKEQLSTFD